MTVRGNSGMGGTSFSIVIAQSQPVMVIALKEVIERLGHVVVAVADTGEEAVAAAAKHSPDVVLMDVALNGAMDGIETAWEINARFGIPTLFFSGMHDRASRARARLAKAVGFVPHTASVSRLTNVIASLRLPGLSPVERPGSGLADLSERPLRRN
jgi:DNA-binding NarL/FixJ family response regulator